ncbi:hypothetical protein I203_100929 [Kwoniella mangroviensis CBS 8507]|uniref:uncharacterized protein n=1 Tax=Kwoniella mangroviensis CBS 8507 TaxID=1296122 RepID=UPI0030698979
MSTAFLGNTVVWGNPTCGGPHLLQLATGDNSTAAVEAGLKAILESHTGFFLGPVMIGFVADFVLFGVMLTQLHDVLYLELSLRYLIWHTFIMSSSTISVPIERLPAQTGVHGWVSLHR